MACPPQDVLDRIFPPEKTDAFFDALYGGAEDGAYDIRLTCKSADADDIELAFELVRRPGKCLKCSLTYGLPEVFRRHPLLNIAEVATRVAQAAGMEGDIAWELGQVRELGDDLHVIPFNIHKKQAE